MKRLTSAYGNRVFRDAIAQKPNLWGALVTMQCGGLLDETLNNAHSWAMDNDRFNADLSIAQKCKIWHDRFLALLERCQEWRDKCLFVVAPDVVCDARATMREFPYWHTVIRGYGYPVAFALQNGVESVGVPWSWIDFVFVGGDDEFKEGPIVARLASEASERGIGVHVGRVNGRRRALIAAKIGADTIDGTQETREPNRAIVHWMHWLREANAITSGQQMRMFQNEP